MSAASWSAAILATIILAFGVRTRKQAFWLSLGVGVALLLAFPVVFFIFVATGNEAFLAATPTAVPHNWMELRASWETGQAIRFALQLAALCMLVLSGLFETRDDTSERVFPRTRWKAGDCTWTLLPVSIA